MTRVVAGVAIALALAVALGVPSFDPPTRSLKAPDDYPLAPGMRWTYLSPGGVKVVRHAGVVRAIDGRAYVEMKFMLPILGTRVLAMRRTAEGVVGWHGGREHLLMRFPMRAGDRWRIDVPGMPGVDDIADCEVIGREEVAFLGRRGVATKLCVTRTNRRTGKRTVDHEWYASGYGLVRMEVTYGLRATFALEQLERAVK